MDRPTFREASDRLCMSARELAGLFGVKVQSVRQARLEAGSKGYRPPPTGWEKKLARAARKKEAEMRALVAALERDSD